MSEKYKVNDFVFDSNLNKHIILTESHPVFNPNTSYTDMCWYYGALKFRDLNTGDKVDAYNSVPGNSVEAEFVGFTRTLKYKVKISDGTIKTFRYIMNN